jgi:carbon-monoxide dehydrogenase small subunit
VSAPADDRAYGPGDAAVPESEAYTLTVNGRPHAVPSAWIGASLLQVLRRELALPGAKDACEQGECGSCTVLMDGVVVDACCVLAADAVDADVRTIEGLGDAAVPTDVQRAFVAAGAVQCGFCTPGLVVAVHDLLERSPEADTAAVREALSGNLCRCTGYGRILAAVADVQRERAGRTARADEDADRASRTGDEGGAA